MNTMSTWLSAGHWLGRVLVAVTLSAALLIPTLPVLAASAAIDGVRQVADPQTNVGGGVTVKVSRHDADDVIAFKVVLDTHSVNLDLYDLGQLAALRTDSGRKSRRLAGMRPPGDIIARVI